MTILAARDWHTPGPAATRWARTCLGLGLVALVAGAAVLGVWLLTSGRTLGVVAAVALAVGGGLCLVAGAVAAAAAVTGDGPDRRSHDRRLTGR